MISLLGISKEELKDIVLNEFYEKSCRVTQILKWLYEKKEFEIDKFTDLPKKFRETLQQKFKIFTLDLVSKEKSNIDGTTKYNFKTYDGYNFSAVYIPKLSRNVVCLSTQVGCSIKCIFCNSGRVDFIRNLDCCEITEQLLRIAKDVGKIDSVLFMGMGEPLLNYENLIKSIKIFLYPEGLSMSKRKITVSTVGVVPNIYKLAEENLGVKLAISLHSYDDNKRKKFVKNLKFSIKDILEAGIFYAKRTKTKLTIEYVLIKDENDKEEDVLGLIRLLKKLSKDISIFKINIIPYNFIEGIEFFSPTEERINNFKKILINNGFLAFIRKPHGLDIKAACGQIGF